MNCSRESINFNKILIWSFEWCFPDGLQTRSFRLPLFFTIKVNVRLFADQVGDWVGEHILTLQPSSDLRCYLGVEGKRSGAGCHLGPLYRREWEPSGWYGLLNEAMEMSWHVNLHTFSWLSKIKLHWSADWYSFGEERDEEERESTPSD